MNKKKEDLDHLVKSIKNRTSIEPEDFRIYLKKNVILKFMEVKEECPNLTKSQLCKKIGISESTLDRNMKDLNIKSFYRHDIPINKRKKLNKNEQMKDLPKTSIDFEIKNPKTKGKQKQNIGGSNQKFEVKHEGEINDEYIDKLIN